MKIAWPNDLCIFQAFGKYFRRLVKGQRAAPLAVFTAAPVAGGGPASGSLPPWAPAASTRRGALLHAGARRSGELFWAVSLELTAWA